MRLRKIILAAAALTMAAAPALGVATASATPATARPHTAPASWNGRCYTNWHTNKAVNMWCDGRGPERYGVSAVCTKGRHTYQYDSTSHPWFGDRRGATVTCRKGTLATWWGYPAD